MFTQKALIGAVLASTCAALERGAPTGADFDKFGTQYGYTDRPDEKAHYFIPPAGMESDWKFGARHEYQEYPRYHHGDGQD